MLSPPRLSRAQTDSEAGEDVAGGVWHARYALLNKHTPGIQFTLVKAAMVTASVLDIDRFVRVQVSAKVLFHCHG